MEQNFDENLIKAKIDQDVKNMSLFKDMFTKIAKTEIGIKRSNYFKLYFLSKLINLFFIKKQILQIQNKVRLIL